jgi:hypothetical protein
MLSSSPFCTLTFHANYLVPLGEIIRRALLKLLDIGILEVLSEWLKWYNTCQASASP